MGRPVALSRPRARGRRRRLRDVSTSYALLLPAVALFALVWGVPLVRSISLSTQETRGAQTRDVGLANFRGLIDDAVTRASFRNALVLIVLVVVPMTVGSLLLALLIDASSRRVRAVVGTLMLLPFVTSPAITAIVFRSLYAENGELNAALDALALPTVSWLSDPFWARVAVSGMVLWTSLGFNTLLMVAGLQRIPKELGEAAVVDGAGPFRVARFITVPLMTPIILFVSVITSFGTFNLFAEPKLLTGGGPANATITPGLAIYEEGFKYGRFGTAAALGLIVGVTALCIAALQLRAGRGRQ